MNDDGTVEYWKSKAKGYKQKTPLEAFKLALLSPEAVEAVFKVISGQVDYETDTKIREALKAAIQKAEEKVKE